jgi:hypothetical protein
MKQHIGLEVWAKNADLTVELYHLVKWALLSGRDELVNDGLFRQKLSGSDFQPAPNYFPEFVYRRALTFWCQFLASTPTDGTRCSNFIQSITPNHTYMNIMVVIIMSEKDNKDSNS